MKTIAEKRAYDRHSLSADVVVSSFNKEHSYYSAQILNIGKGGMCFNSSLLLKPGATVIIHLKKIHSEAAVTGSCEALRSVTLGEVKWCSELTDAKALHYGVGVKYFESPY
ncbi:PilZ domain-containing protein [Thermodesulfobacteriota bacterium]